MLGLEIHLLKWLSLYLVVSLHLQVIDLVSRTKSALDLQHTDEDSESNFNCKSVEMPAPKNKDRVSNLQTPASRLASQAGKLKVLPRSLSVATPPPAPSPAPSIVYIITPASLTKEMNCIITNDQVVNNQECNLSPEKDHLENILSQISKEELEWIMEIINQWREEKLPTALSGLKRCKACKKEKPSREFVSLQQPETMINTCKDCQKPLALSTSPGRWERDSERDKESEELELERSRMSVMGLLSTPCYQVSDANNWW